MRGGVMPLVLVLVAAATGACARDDAIRARTAGDRDERAAEAPPLETTTDPAMMAEPRPRLRHTVTLGESVGGDVPGDAGSAAGGAPSPGVVVIDAPYGVGGYGLPGWVGSPGWDAWSPFPGWYGPLPSEPPVRRPASGRPWSPPPEYGPRFPFKTAPADPWR